MPENIVYWVNMGKLNNRHGIIHTSSCPQHREQADGWYGPYASRGAAIDIIFRRGRVPWESGDCIFGTRVNCGDKPK